MKKEVGGEIYFTPKQAAKYFNLSLSTIKNYIYAGKLKTLKTPGGHHRIRRSELLITLGDRSKNDEDRADFSLRMSLCSAFLGIFKTLGEAGRSLHIHAQQVSELSGEVARAMYMSRDEIKRIEIAGLLHDIGHAGIERHILFKKGRLTSEEYESIKHHPGIGQEILDSTKEFRDIADIVVQHHERIDGEGYPKRLDGRRIQKNARIISIAEAYDSMVSRHSYKEAVPKDMAIAELMRERDRQFDGDIAELFMKII